MNPFQHNSACLLACLGLLSPCAATAAETPPPNIVLIFADDLGWGDPACYGHPYAKTPNIDKLAAEGTRFTQAYVTGVTCNPSRTGLMTGRFPARYTKNTADFGFAGHQTITGLLKVKGYRTGHFGKWHIGPESKAGTYGIDEIGIMGGSHDNPEGRDADLFTAALGFIGKSAGAKQPFYVNIWAHSTHFPVHVPASLSAEFAAMKVKRADFSETTQHKFHECVKIGGDLDESMRQYLGDVFALDRNVGRVLAELEKLGLSGNTIVVFSSDHGPAPVVLGKKEPREFSNNMLGYAGEYRGGKHEQYEGGVRVPFIVRWPGRVQPGRVDKDSVLSFADWLPTLCGIAGITDIPKDIDGEDVSAIWLGESRKRTKPLFWKTSSTNSTTAMREGNWKLHLPNKRKSGAELYDLSADPSESRNLADANPAVLAAMRKKAAAWIAELPEDYVKGEGGGED